MATINLTIDGQPLEVPAGAADGMVIVTQNERIKEKRQENLMPIMARHCQACPACAQQEGCPSSMSPPV